MSTIYVIGKIITLPGAYLKTFWEHFVCRLLGIPVETGDYLVYDERLGHVEHEFPKTLPRTFLFAWLPGLINRLLGIPMFFAGALGIVYLGVEPIIRESGEKTWIFFVYLVLLYLGISLLCNIFPLVEDALLLWDKLYGKNSSANIVWKVLLFIPTACMLIGS
ncbi:MAG: hypothetical protein GXZ02_10680 [Clostridiales bacterium]|nr:hypothetical protein [Clostridiales bacterium]